MRRRQNHGFTLIEVLVTVVLVSIAVVGVLRGIQSISSTDAKANSAELLQRLASEKLHELSTIADPATADTSGDFSDQGYSDITWTLDPEVTGTSYVDQVTVTVTQGNNEQSVTGLVYVAPTTTGSGT